MSARPTVLPPKGAPDVLYLVDLSGYVFRAFHAIAPLTNARGEPTQASLGTTTMIQKLVEERRPALLGVALDSEGPRVRTEIDARYKAHRPLPPPELSIQLRRAREIVEAFRIPTFRVDGLEADDVIAFAVARARERGLVVVIVSSDKDLMQLVGPDVMLWDTMRDRVYGEPEVFAKFGVPPSQLRDLLALVGDTSDNVPGVPGIGPKTAADLLTQFGSLDAIYARIDEVKRPKLKASLLEHEADARVSRELVTLRAADVGPDTEFDLDGLRAGEPDLPRLRALLTELGFTRLVKALPAPAEAAMSFAPSYRLVSTKADLAAVVARARVEERLALAVIGTSTEATRAELVGVALATAPGDAAYVPVGHRYLGAPAQLSIAELREVLGPVLADASVAKIGHDVKYAEVVLARRGLELAGVVMDTMLASYLLDPEQAHELAAITERVGSAALEDPAAPGPKKRAPRPFDELEVEEAAARAGRRAEAPLLLASRLTPRLEAEGLSGLLRDLELPLARVLATMERVGVLVDPGALEHLGKEMATELATLEHRAQEAAGQEFNLGSPKQLEAILFDKLGLEATKRTKTGRSTDAEALEAIADDHPLPRILLEHRAIAKLKGTYVDALPRLIHADTGRIHTRWSQAVAATGRLSSQDPNLQNIPIRTALGRVIRRAFIAPPGFAFVSADYSQIELRVLAHLSKDPVLVDAFQRAQDVHVRTAMEVFGVDEAGVTKEMRARSKTINFGVIYGMGDNALAKRLGISRTEAAHFIEAYFQRYAGVHAFMEKTLADARRTEVVHTLFGRRRDVAEVHSSDRQRRSYAERIAQNTPIQGTAADLLKLAMIRLSQPVVPGARMVLTVHDELGFEVPEGAVAEATEKIRLAMETVHPFDVPLVVDVGAGRTWADT